MISRRKFLKKSMMGTMALSSLGILSRCEKPWKKPNILFVICDDLNDWVGHLNGHPQVQTPYMDKLANSSFTFTNAHCNAPLCGPSRASVFSGLQPYTSLYYGYQQNDGNTWRSNPNLKNTSTMMEHFHDNGYIVWGSGKTFHNSQHLDTAFDYEGDSVSGYGADHDFGPWPYDGKQKRAHPSNRPPFSEFFMKGVASFSDVPSFEPDPDKNIPGYEGWVLKWSDHEPFHYNGPDDRSLAPDEQNTKWASERLQENHDRPFLMVVGHQRPHIPYYAPKKFFDMYSPLEDVKLPSYLEGDLNDIPESLRMYSDDFETLFEHFPGKMGWRKQVQGYLACVSFVDHEIGKLMKALENSDYADNTIVVITGDHGYHNYEKEYRGKMSNWERSTRIPLIVKLPGQTRGYRIDAPVSLIDLFPTFNELCGLDNHPNKDGNGLELDGESLKPYFENPEYEPEEGSYVITSTFGQDEDQLSKFPQPKELQEYTIRSKRYRYTLQAGTGDEEFYDHAEDPHEWYNSIDKPEYKDEIKKHKEKLIEKVGLDRNKYFQK